MKSTTTERTFRAPEVNVRAEGRDGYTVVYRSVAGGPPADLRVFRFDRQLLDDESATIAVRAMHKRGVSNAADAYRDGVAEGLFLAARILSTLIGAGV